MGAKSLTIEAAIKKKHSKTGEESRFQGTLLGKDADLQQVTIVGGPASSMAEWTRLALSRNTSSPRPHSHQASQAHTDEAATPASSGISSAPPTPSESSQ